jgi:hypothetical protein
MPVENPSRSEYFGLVGLSERSGFARYHFILQDRRKRSSVPRRNYRCDLKRTKLLTNLKRGDRKQRALVHDEILLALTEPLCRFASLFDSRFTSNVTAHPTAAWQQLREAIAL